MKIRERFIQEVAGNISQGDAEAVVRHLIEKGMLDEHRMSGYVQRSMFMREWNGTRDKVVIMKVCEKIGDELGKATSTVHDQVVRALRLS